MIRLTIPSIDEDDRRAVDEVLESGFLVQGKKVAAFEQKVAEYLGVEHAVAVSNGTAALHISLLALDVRPGDLVLTTAYSFLATANVIELCGAQPVFVDILPDTFNMDMSCLADILKRLMSIEETRKRVKAILPVHAFGLMADMRTIQEIADEYQIPVIEDAACALGSSLFGKLAGTWGKVGCFSFHPRKAITTGEGGLISTDDANIAKRLRALRNHGIDPDSQGVEFIMAGFNYRITDFQAALGLSQMNKLDRILAARIERAGIYDQLLVNTPYQLPAAPPDSKHIYQSYVCLVPQEMAARRLELIEWVKERGVETTIGTWHMPLSTYFRNRYKYALGDFPVTDDVFQRSLTLPLHEYLDQKEQYQIVELLTNGLNHC
jgi:perosamine synthetase